MTSSRNSKIGPRYVEGSILNPKNQLLDPDFFDFKTLIRAQKSKISKSQKTPVLALFSKFFLLKPYKTVLLDALYPCKGLGLKAFRPNLGPLLPYGNMASVSIDSFGQNDMKNISPATEA